MLLDVRILLDHRAELLTQARRLVKQHGAAALEVREEQRRPPLCICARERQNRNRADIPLRTLRLEIELAQRIDFVIEELDAHGRRAINRKDIDDAAARRELPHRLDFLDTCIAEVGEAADELPQADVIARADAQAQPLEIATRHALGGGRRHRREHDEVLAAQQPPEHVHAPRRALEAPRRSLDVLGCRIDLRQLEHGDIWQQRPQVLPPRFKALAAVDEHDCRPRRRRKRRRVDGVLLRT